MIPRLLTFILILFLQWDAQSQSLLWKISGNGLQTPSYLYGTIHIKDKRVFEWSDSVYNRIDQCEALIEELNFDSIDYNKVAQDMTLPKGTSLHTLFTAEDYALIQKAFESCSGIPISSFEQVKPFILVTVCMYMKMKNDLDAAIDELLYKHAKSKGKIIMGLETLEEQDSVMNLIPNSYVTEYFKKLDKEIEATEIMIKYYQQANLDSLLVMMDEDESGTFMKEDMIVSRNGRMVDRMIPEIKKQSSFIAIGAAHLPGTEGVIELLQKKGYKVEPIKIF